VASRKHKKAPKPRSGVARAMILAGVRGSRFEPGERKAKERKSRWRREDWGDEEWRRVIRRTKLGAHLRRGQGTLDTRAHRGVAAQEALVVPRDPQAVALRVRTALSPDLLKEPWRSRVLARRCDPMTGHCYIASEAAYHLLGGKRAGWQPMFVRHEGQPHWFLVGPRGEILDITARQFKTPVRYSRAIGKGFLTTRPSKRARIVIGRVVKS